MFNPTQIERTIATIGISSLPFPELGFSTATSEQIEHNKQEIPTILIPAMQIFRTNIAVDFLGDI